MSAETRN